MSEVKVNKITPTADCGTVTLGDSGDTVAIPAGVTLTSGGALQNSGTITNTGTITGVAITGTIDNQVNWQTTVKTSTFTATAGEGYFCNTTSGAFTVNLPASPSAGDLVGIKDYANTADTNNIIIGRNGSNIEGVANNYIISVEGGSITLIYVDATKGWLSTAAAKASDITEQTLFLTATGGTITTSGDFKIHTFTGPGTFCVSCAGNSIGNDKLSYLVIAGGAAGGNLGGGGAGGFRESKASTDSYTASPLNATSGPTYNLTVTAQGYPITVGAGGAGSGFPYGAPGSNSIFSTITSTGGGGGPAGPFDTGRNGQPGGSGGGGHGSCSGPGVGGTGNTPPVSPSQGNNGGNAGNVPGIASVAGGGGGAGAVGAEAPGAPSKVSANGGNGVATSITNSSVTRAGGGGGGLYILFGGCGPTDGTKGTGGSGGGGNGGGQTPPGTPNATAGTTNTGSGGGGAGLGNCGTGITSGSGGSGIVVIRYKFQ